MTSKNPAQGRQRIHLGVTTLAWLNIYQTLKQIAKDAIAPEIQSIKGDIKALEARIVAVDGHVMNLEAEIAGLRAEIAGLRADFHARFEEQGRQWELAMEVRERLASLEAQIRRR
jgi:phage shock protein A